MRFVSRNNSWDSVHNIQQESFLSKAVSNSLQKLRTGVLFLLQALFSVFKNLLLKILVVTTKILYHERVQTLVDGAHSNIIKNFGRLVKKWDIWECRTMWTIYFITYVYEYAVKIVTKIGYQILFHAVHLSISLNHTRLPHCLTTPVHTWKHTVYSRVLGLSRIIRAHRQPKVGIQCGTVNTYAYHQGSSI